MTLLLLAGGFLLASAITVLVLYVLAEIVDLLRFAGEAGDELAARRRQELFDLEQQLRSVRWLRGDADARDLRAIERRLAAMRRRSDRRAA